jgi:hypothetical protein
MYYGADGVFGDGVLGGAIVGVGSVVEGSVDPSDPDEDEIGVETGSVVEALKLEVSGVVVAAIVVDSGRVADLLDELGVVDEGLSVVAVPVGDPFSFKEGSAVVFASFDDLELHPLRMITGNITLAVSLMFKL